MAKNLDPKIKNFEEFVARRKSEGATEDELERLYDDLNGLKMNQVLGDLFDEDA